MDRKTKTNLVINILGVASIIGISTYNHYDRLNSEKRLKTEIKRFENDVDIFINHAKRFENHAKSLVNKLEKGAKIYKK